jgi:hypothetical protein
MKRPAIASCVLAGLAGAGIVWAQGPTRTDIYGMRPVQAAPAAAQEAKFGRPPAQSVGGTVFNGRADRHSRLGEVHVYEGHVALTFPSSSQLVVSADKAIWNGTTLSVEGNVRIALDVK